MPMNGLNIGRDCTLSLVTTEVGALNMPVLMDYEPKPKLKKDMVIPMNGDNIPLQFMQGWDLSFTIERSNGVIDDYWALVEANYFNGVPQQAATLTETIGNPDGSVNIYRYESLIIALESMGSWKGDTDVPVKMSGQAARRIKVQ
jgi:hypothetical protein